MCLLAALCLVLPVEHRWHLSSYTILTVEPSHSKTQHPCNAAVLCSTQLDKAVVGGRAPINETRLRPTDPGPGPLTGTGAACTACSAGQSTEAATGLTECIGSAPCTTCANGKFLTACSSEDLERFGGRLHCVRGWPVHGRHRRRMHRLRHWAADRRRG